MAGQPDARSALVCSVFAGGLVFACPGFVDDQDWRALWALVRVGRAWRAAFGGALRHLPDRLAANDAALGAVLGAIPEVARRLAAALDGLETPAIAEVLPMKRLPHGLGPVFSAAVLLSGVCRPTATTNWELLVRNKPNSWPACVTLIRKAGGARALVAALRAASAAACGHRKEDDGLQHWRSHTIDQHHCRIESSCAFPVAEEVFYAVENICAEPWFNVEDMRRKSSAGAALVVWIDAMMDMQDLYLQNPQTSRRYTVVRSRLAEVRDRFAYVAARPFVCAESGKRFRTASERSAHRADLRLKARRRPASARPAASPASARATARPASAPRRRPPAARRLTPEQERREAAQRKLGERPRWRI